MIAFLGSWASMVRRTYLGLLAVWFVFCALFMPALTAVQRSYGQWSTLLPGLCAFLLFSWLEAASIRLMAGGEPISRIALAGALKGTLRRLPVLALLHLAVLIVPVGIYWANSWLMGQVVTEAVWGHRFSQALALAALGPVAGIVLLGKAYLATRSQASRKFWPMARASFVSIAVFGSVSIVMGLGYQRILREVLSANPVLLVVTSVITTALARPLICAYDLAVFLHCEGRMDHARRP